MFTSLVTTGDVYEEDMNFRIGKAIPVREGKDIAIIATGTMVHYAKAAAEILAEKGVDGDGSGRKFYNLTHLNGQWAGGIAKCGSSGASFLMISERGSPSMSSITM